MKNFFSHLFALFLTGLSSLAFFAITKDIHQKGSPKRTFRPGGENAMQIKSSAFAHNEIIPKKYSCEGENVNPPLEFLNVPSEAVSMVFIMFDGDALVPGGWTHWTLFNFSPMTGGISENSTLPDAIESETSFGLPGYGGPCPPPSGLLHHYEFRLYALDSMLTLDARAKKEDIEHAMEGHIIAHDTLIGLYQRKVDS